MALVYKTGTAENVAYGKFYTALRIIHVDVNEATIKSDHVSTWVHAFEIKLLYNCGGKFIYIHMNGITGIHAIRL